MAEAETLAPVLPPDVDRAVRDLLERACEREVTLATAESCTGGMVASLLTDVPGCSHAFERGFVTYTDEAKQDMLGISPELIRREGAVSKAVAVAMAEGALARSRATLAVSVTGFAGDGAEPGLVHFACARKDRDTLHREEHFGDIGRGEIRLACMRTAVELLEAML